MRRMGCGGASSIASLTLSLHRARTDRRSRWQDPGFAVGHLPCSGSPTGSVVWGGHGKQARGPMQDALQPYVTAVLCLRGFGPTRCSSGMTSGNSGTHPSAGGGANVFVAVRWRRGCWVATRWHPFHASEETSHLVMTGVDSPALAVVRTRLFAQDTRQRIAFPSSPGARYPQSGVGWLLGDGSIKPLGHSASSRAGPHGGQQGSAGRGARQHTEREHRQAFAWLGSRASLRPQQSCLPGFVADRWAWARDTEPDIGPGAFACGTAGRGFSWQCPGMSLSSVDFSRPSVR